MPDSKKKSGVLWSYQPAEHGGEVTEAHETRDEDRTVRTLSLRPFQLIVQWHPSIPFAFLHIIMSSGCFEIINAAACAWPA